MVGRSVGRSVGVLGELEWPRLVPNDFIKCTFFWTRWTDGRTDADGDSHDQTSAHRAEQLACSVPHLRGSDGGGGKGF